jgi:hypothetical protein
MQSLACMLCNGPGPARMVTLYLIYFSVMDSQFPLATPMHCSHLFSGHKIFVSMVEAVTLLDSGIVLSRQPPDAPSS